MLLIACIKNIKINEKGGLEQQICYLKDNKQKTYTVSNNPETTRQLYEILKEYFEK
jgi:hypothetical protein